MATTFYSILTAIIRPEIQERIAVGLLLMGKEGVYFNYSTNKLAAVRTILHDTDYRLFKDYLQMVESKATEMALENGQISFDKKDNVFNEEYINYLSRYNNNMLGFTPVKSIDMPATGEVFDKLFARYIDDVDQPKPVEHKRTFEVFRRKNETRLKPHYTIEQEIYTKELPALIAPVKVDLIGINEIPVYAQAVDMNRRLYHIENDLGQLLFLRNAFQEGYKNVKEFVVTSEPPKSQLKQHAVWKQLRASKQFTYVDEREAEQLIIYAEEHGVRPLLQS